MSNFTSAQLASEINTDPAGVGYAAHVAAGADGAVAAQLNAVGAGAPYVVNREPIAAGIFTALIDEAEFAAASQGARDYLRMLATGGTIDINNAIIKGALNALITQAAWPNTRARLIASLTRQGSRAEVLWGVLTTVSATDVAHALRGGF